MLCFVCQRFRTTYSHYYCAFLVIMWISDVILKSFLHKKTCKFCWPNLWVVVFWALYTFVFPKDIKWKWFEGETWPKTLEVAKSSLGFGKHLEQWNFEISWELKDFKVSEIKEGGSKEKKSLNDKTTKLKQHFNTLKISGCYIECLIIWLYSRCVTSSLLDLNNSFWSWKLLGISLRRGSTMTWVCLLFHQATSVSHLARSQLMTHTRQIQIGA